jgi:hypothetical protein
MGIEIDGPPCRTCDSLRVALDAARGEAEVLQRKGEELCCAYGNALMVLRAVLIDLSEGTHLTRETVARVADAVKGAHPAPAAPEGFEEWHRRECPWANIAGTHCAGARWKTTYSKKFYGKTCREVYEFNGSS